MSWGEFKAAASEVGNWCWGAVRGGFNEKQTIGQVVTDAVISMFPVAGEITATRDVVAALIRMSDDPKKREETAEWIMLVLPLLALVPLFGGALKGIGKLLMRVGRSAAEDREIFRAVIALLNKIGHGDAVKFLRELDFGKYARPIVDGVNEAAGRVRNGLEYLQKQMAPVLPKEVIERMETIRVQIKRVQRLANRMVPQALRNLNARLKTIQQLAYQGEWHLIPSAGKIKAREIEARLVTTAEGKVWKVGEMPHPPSTVKDYQHREDWPDLKTGDFVEKVKSGEVGVAKYTAIEAFSGPILAKELPSGTVIYRIITETSNSAGWWWCYYDPKTITGLYWRIKFAVLQSWSHNGKYVKYVVPPGKALRVWEGKVASQIDNVATYRGKSNRTFGQFLEGGETQLLIDFGHESNQYAAHDVRALPKLDTNWTDHMNINIPEQKANVQYLGKHEVEQKTLASANLSSTSNIAGKATHAVNDERAQQHKQ
jgi:hypothetical protein